MRDNGILLLILAAIAAFGGFLLSLGVDFSPGQQVEAVVNCASAHPEWDSRVCRGVSEGRYTTQDVLENPSWDWESIGSGRLQLGMTTSMVEAAWGVPDYVNTSGNAGYGEEWAMRDRLLQFENGQLASIQAAPVWTAEQVLSAAWSNKADLELRTRNREILLVGRISDIGSGLDGSPRIEFQLASYYGEIHCFVPPERTGEAGSLRKGQTIVLLGIGDGMGLVGPTFRDCRVFALP